MQKAQEIMKKYLEGNKLENLLNELKENNIYFSSEENLDIRYSKLKNDAEEKNKLYEEAQKHIEEYEQTQDRRKQDDRTTMLFWQQLGYTKQDISYASHDESPSSSSSASSCKRAAFAYCFRNTRRSASSRLRKSRCISSLASLRFFSVFFWFAFSSG